MLYLCRDSTKFIRAWLCARCSIGCLNALQMGTEVPIHHHPTKDESFILLKGRVRVTTYHDDGTIKETIVLCHEEGRYGVDIPKNTWHALECLEPDSVIFEVKEGPFVQHEEEGILEIAK